jgi:hypothetical protein
MQRVIAQLISGVLFAGAVIVGQTESQPTDRAGHALASQPSTPVICEGIPYRLTLGLPDDPIVDEGLRDVIFAIVDARIEHLVDNGVILRTTTPFSQDEHGTVSVDLLLRESADLKQISQGLTTRYELLIVDASPVVSIGIGTEVPANARFPESVDNADLSNADAEGDEVTKTLVLTLRPQGVNKLATIVANAKSVPNTAAVIDRRVTAFQTIGTPIPSTVNVDISPFFTHRPLSDAEAFAAEVRLPKPLVASWTTLPCS